MTTVNDAFTYFTEPLSKRFKIPYGLDKNHFLAEVSKAISAENLTVEQLKSGEALLTKTCLDSDFPSIAKCIKACKETAYAPVEQKKATGIGSDYTILRSIIDEGRDDAIRDAVRIGKLSRLVSLVRATGKLGSYQPDFNSTAWKAFEPRPEHEERLQDIAHHVLNRPAHMPYQPRQVKNYDPVQHVTDRVGADSPWYASLMSIAKHMVQKGAQNR